MNEYESFENIFLDALDKHALLKKSYIKANRDHMWLSIFNNTILESRSEYKK